MLCVDDFGSASMFDLVREKFRMIEEKLQEVDGVDGAIELFFRARETCTFCHVFFDSKVLKCSSKCPVIVHYGVMCDEVDVYSAFTEVENAVDKLKAVCEIIKAVDEVEETYKAYSMKGQ